MKETVCLVTGGFNPVHSGHIAYIASAKKTVIALTQKNNYYTLLHSQYLKMELKSR